MKSRETKPFVYLVGWISKRKYYVGVKYMQGATPECLGKNYFTSSKDAKALWAQQAPDFMDIYPMPSAAEAKKMEVLLQEHFDVTRNDDFLNKNIAGIKFSSKPMPQAQKEHLRKLNTGKKMPPRSKRHLDNLRQAFERPLQTPFGVFESRKKAAQAIGIAASTLGWRIERYPSEYYYI